MRLDGTQFNQPGPYNQDGPTLHPVVKAKQRHQRISELKELAKGNKVPESPHEMEPPQGKDTEVESLKARIARIEHGVKL
jgi:hypothetical protein